VSSSPKTTSDVDWKRFAQLIDSKQKIALTTHVRPDCDAVGSELAMASILTKLGKEVRCINPFEVPPNLRFLDPESKLEQLGQGDTRQWLETADLLIVLDTSAFAQLGEMGDVIRTTSATKAVVDHHVSGDEMGAELFKNTSAEATGRLVFEAAEHLGVELTPPMAVAIYAALATDTGWFRFSSTTALTYRIAAALTEAGAVPEKIYKDLYENDTIGRLRLVGRAMARTEIELDGRLIYTWIELDDFKASGALASDTEDVINLTLSVGGTQVAVIFVEQQTGGFKLSFRSRCDVDCSQLAEEFGGGGHRKAAGAFLKESLDDAKTKVLDVVRAAM
jgi:bifunctional oligoribonuclease and PAP phosphatase NrnA